MVDYNSQTIDGLRKIAEQKLKAANEKKEDLRQYVGVRYRDLLRSADAILEMKELCKQAFERISTLTETLNNITINDTHTRPHPYPHDKPRKLADIASAAALSHAHSSSTEGTSVVRTHDFDTNTTDNVHTVQSLCVAICKLPEVIWAFLDDCEFSLATQ